MGIKQDFANGKDGEKLVVDLLEKFKLKPQFNNNYDKRHDFDVLFELMGKSYSIEVKYDIMAAKTGNIAIEVHNTKSNNSSGLSITKADLWVQVLSPTHIYFASTIKLREFIENTKPLKKIEYGGDGNARLFIFKKEIILNNCFDNLAAQKKNCAIKRLREMLNASE